MSNQDPVELRQRIEQLEAQLSALQGRSNDATRIAGSEPTSAGITLEQLVQSVIDIGVELVRAEFGAFFYRTTDASGQHLTLYTLSGAPREAFAAYPLPGRTHLFRATFDNEGIVRCDDVQDDPRYGKCPPFYGMPPGHLPVRSYLAAPVVAASNEVLGGLFFGHPNAGVFTERSERILLGVAQLASMALENSRLLRAVQDRERHFKALIENSGEGIAITDALGVISYISPAVATIEGFAVEECIGTHVRDRTHPDDLPLLDAAFARVLNSKGEKIPLIVRRLHSDGTYRWIESVASNLLHEPAVRGVVCNFRDVTERRRAEDALIRSQKMEALGTLAGGIAHDFNNLLLAISGNAKLALEDLSEGKSAERSLAEINKAAQRATDLVGRILAFSRQQESKKEIVALAPIVDEALKLLRATLPAMIELKVNLAADLPMVAADASQIHQVVMNLVTNAAHAVGERGTVEITLDAITNSADAPSVRELKPGLYARISVSDNGCGMSPATVRRIFDPFFTTKPAGRGTGLGLSVVHGIVKAHEGVITVYSQPGKGSAFHVYLAAASGKSLDIAPARPAPTPGHGQRVLYIDDDSAIVFLTGRILEKRGYRVTGIENPFDALDLFRKSPHDFDVVVTDLSMPGMSGFHIARQLQTIRPDIPILMTSGYVRPEDREAAREHGIRDVLLKPNSVEDLGTALEKLFTQIGAPSR